MDSTKTVVIVGAGPAGLTAALELVEHAGYRVVIAEADTLVGGISKTVNYKGNRIDIGGHRFFSKSDWVMDFWQRILPLEERGADGHEITYRNSKRTVVPLGADETEEREVMLIRPRLSRIYFLRKFFDYPLKINLNTIRNLGFVRLFSAVLSYTRARLFPVKEERNLRDFIVNRFGHELYRTFFKDYTEKVWGVPCEEISADWGAQRIKGVSVSAVIRHALISPITRLLGIETKRNTSLIEQFLYPKYGPGQLWEKVADLARDQGAQLLLGTKVTGIHVRDGCVVSVDMQDLASGEKKSLACDYLVSTMPVRELIAAINPVVPDAVSRVAAGLLYRDFITVGLLLEKFKKSKYTLDGELNMLPDNWIYIQEPDVRVGRLQIFNNWSPYMVGEGNRVWIGLEYFCSESDDLWSMGERELIELATGELTRIGLIDEADVLDAFVLKVPKAYPAYFGTYDQFDTIREYSDSIKNLYLVGRNGMHRYNNQDHSMVTAKIAVESIVSGQDRRAEIWAVNIDDDYHEEVKAS